MSMRTSHTLNDSRRKYFALFALSLTMSLACVIITGAEKAKAAYDGGNIIDNSIFLNAAAMSKENIQSFLESKGAGLANLSFVLDCDVAGAQGKQAYLSIGAPCGSNIPASHIIYYASQIYGVNPQVTLATMQKEQSLTTAANPTSWQLNQAMGYACPTSGNCEESSSFFYQIDNGTWVKRFHYERARGNMNWWYTSTSWTCGTSKPSFYTPNLYPGQNVNFIDPYSGVHYATIYIQNAATSAFYCYTPHAFNNHTNSPHPQELKGSSRCYPSHPSAGSVGRCYTGSYNFVKFFELWFGSTRNGEHVWRVIQAPNDARLFLQVGNTKRWIPNGEIYADWRLNQYQTEQLTANEFDAIPTIPDLTRLGTSGQYHYIVEGGRRHYIPNNYLSLWGYQNTIAAPVNSLLLTIPEYEPVGRFMKSADGSYWLMNGGVRHYMATSDVHAWGVNSANVVGITDSYLLQISASTPLTRFVKSSGTDYVVDQGGLLRMPDAATAQTWSPGGFTSIGSAAIGFTPSRGDAGFLVKATDSPHWFMLIDGKKYYVPSGNHAVNWGASPSGLVPIESSLLSQFPSGGNLTNFTKDITTQAVYLLDGQKHHITSGDLLSTVITSASEVLDSSSARLSKISNGSAYSKPFVIISNTPHLYLLDAGKRYHVHSMALSNAFNSSGYLQLSGSFISAVPQSSAAIHSVFKDEQDNLYLADGGKKRMIDASVEDAWKSSLNPTLSDELVGMLPAGQGVINSPYVKLSGVTYVIDQGTKIKVNPSLLTNYPGSGSAATQDNDTLPVSSTQANHLLKSRDDQKVWFINQGAKTEVGFAQQVTLGYLSAGLVPAVVDNTFLTTIPTSSSASLLIKKQNSWGVKMVNFGHSLGFPDGNTLANLAGASNPIIVVDDWTYDQFPLSGTITRIVQDDSGKLYLLENGQRRWITNWVAYQQYRQIPVTYLYGTTHSLIPVGAPIN